jgi:serine/threonine-protein kinase
MDAHSQHKRDVIAAQQRRWAEGAVDSGTSASLSLAPSSKASELELSTAPSKWRMRAAWALVGFGAVAAMGIVVYLARGIQHEMAVRTELLRAYHEEQAFRPATPQEPEVTGALEMTSKPVGAAIWINGTLRAEVTPATIDKLSLDRELHIKIVKDGFEAFRTTTRLTDESPFKESDADMKPIPATVIVHVDPPEKSAVWIDGKPWRGDHWVIEGVSPGVEHWLIIAAPGYVARMASLTPLAGETRALSVHLVKAGH